MSRTEGDDPAASGGDLLDAPSGLVRVESAGTGLRWRFDRRLALGLSPTPALGLLLLPLGVALGPQGLDLLSPPLLSYLDPVVSVALAVLGVFGGLGLDIRRRQEARLAVAASLEAGQTILVVGAGVLFALSRWSAPDPLAPGLFAILLGVCASASATRASDVSDESGALAMRIGDLDDLLPIVVGGVAIAWMREPSWGAGLWLAAQAGGVALATAIAAWLLVGQGASESEQRVFAIGGLLLLGGAAEYLSLSALLAGLIAGIFWNLASGPACDRIRRDVSHVQHPLVVLLLVIAGARADFSLSVAGLAIAFVVLRVTGKVGGAWIIGWMFGAGRPRHLGLRLIPPGIVGVAFALDALQAGGSQRVAPLLAIAVAGALGSELISLVPRALQRPA